MSFELPTTRRLKLLRGEDPGKPAWFDDWVEAQNSTQTESNAPPLTLEDIRRAMEGVHVVLGPPEVVGRLPVRTELQVLPADDSSQRRLGFEVYESIGVGVMNPRGVTSLGIVTDD